MTFHNFRAFRGGSVQARPGQFLTDDQLQRVAPSIFATEAHESRSHRFAAVPTIDVLNGLRAEGFQPVMAAQARTRDESRRDFTKHMLRLRHEGQSLRTIDGAGSAFEIVLVNANDGTAAYHMIPGVFRMVCANGMIAGETFDHVKVRHSGNAVSDVIEGAYRVLGEAPRIGDQIDAFRAITLNRDEQAVLAEAAHVLRFPDHHKVGEDRRETPITAAQLLQPRRMADNTGDLWATFNRLQENVIRGGLSGWQRNAQGQRRRVSTREVAGIDQNRDLNRALWTLTERMAELKAA